MTTTQKVFIAASVSMIFASAAFSQMPIMWKKYDWSEQWGNDNNPWNNKQSKRLVRMSQDITETLMANSENLGPQEQFRIAQQLREIRQYIDSVTPQEPPPFVFPPGGGPDIQVVGSVTADVSNSGIIQQQWIQVHLNQPSRIDAVQLVALKVGPGMQPNQQSYIRIYEVIASIGQMRIAQSNQIIDVIPGMPSALQLIAMQPVDTVWVRAEALNGRFKLNATVIDRKMGPGFPGGGFHNDNH